MIILETSYWIQKNTAMDKSYVVFLLLSKNNTYSMDFYILTSYFHFKSSNLFEEKVLAAFGLSLFQIHNLLFRSPLQKSQNPQFRVLSLMDTMKQFSKNGNSFLSNLTNCSRNNRKNYTQNTFCFREQNPFRDILDLLKPFSRKFYQMQLKLDLPMNTITSHCNWRRPLEWRFGLLAK